MNEKVTAPSQHRTQFMSIDQLRSDLQVPNPGPKFFFTANACIKYKQGSRCQDGGLLPRKCISKYEQAQGNKDWNI